MRRPKLKMRLAHVLLAGNGLMLMLLVGGIFMPHRQLPPTAIDKVELPKPTAGISPVTSNRGLPKRLDIPALGVGASVSYMGISKAGVMEAPGNAFDVGWYKYGPLPGNKGSAVIAGHIDGSKGEPGVFSRLDELKPGDRLTVSDTQNNSTSFTVKESKVYDHNEQPQEVFASEQGVHLNLITCTGDWDAGQHRFLKRLVVFTDKTI